MADITTGTELNAYRGDAALADGYYSGYESPTLAPLEKYALTKYEVNLKNYEQQQKDKKDLEDHFSDPKLYEFLDKEYADQVAPQLDRIKELSKMNLQMNPNSKEWYEFHNAYNEVIGANARLKAVQKMKNEYKDWEGATADPHEKERLAKHVKKLQDYKLGDEIPVYDQYFAFNQKHIPTGEIAMGKIQRIVPGTNELQTVEKTMYNPKGLDVAAKRMRVTDPESYQTGLDIAHTLIQHDEGLEDVNKAMQQTYSDGLILNVQLLEKKYADEFAAAQKANPKATFTDFMINTGRGAEIQAEKDALAYLQYPLRFETIDPGDPKLEGFTYSDDGTKMLNVNDDMLRAIYGATQKPPGVTEKIIDSKISALPADIALKREKAKTEAAKRTQLAAQTKKLNKETESIKIPESQNPQVTREGEVRTIVTTTTNPDGTTTKTERKVGLVNAENLSPELQKLVGYVLPPKPKATQDDGQDVGIKKQVPAKGADGKDLKDAAGDPVMVEETTTTKQGKKVVSKEAQKEYDEEVKKVKERGMMSIRFFTKDGIDKSDDVFRTVEDKSKKLTIAKFANDAADKGIIVKYYDRNGKLITTSQEIDLKTQEAANKSSSKGDATYGTDLVSDVDADEEE